MAHMIINTTGKGRGTVHMDGREIHAIASFAIRGEAGSIDKVELNLIALDGIGYEGEAKVTLPDEAVKTLIELGWTPPKDQ